MIQRALLAVAVVAALVTGAAAPAQARSPRFIDDNDTLPVPGNVHRLARPEFDRGACDPDLPMGRMVLTLKRSSERQKRLEALLASQQDPASPDYHRFLSPEEFGRQFGPSPEESAAVTGWLTSHGFSVEEVPGGGGSVVFSGKAAQVERAFHTRMRDYLVDGELHHANAVDPALPRGLSDLVGGVVSLHDFKRRPFNSGARPLGGSPQPLANFGSSHYLSPADFATIYNVNPLYAQGIDGTGQAIAVVGRSHTSSSNWTTFRSTMGLPANPPVVIVNGTDPKALGGGEDIEADLDVEWSGAVAKNATVYFVVSSSTAFTDGVDLSAQYIVSHNLAPVMTTSFGSCESAMGASENLFYNNLWQQAAAQGITAFVSSGDSGAAGCNAGSDPSGSGAAVNGLASTPYNVAVGGTQFSDAGGGFWASANGPGYSSALGYIPEVAWNESGNVTGGAGLWATGGGASLTYPKPSWQVAPGVPADGRRDLPDVSLSAAAHVGYLIQSGGTLNAVGGTSASSPAFAGLMALIVQKTGQRQGNANPRFYQLAAAQFASGGAAVFHDTSSGGNSVPGVAGFSSASGYDLATGLGSVDALALASNWALPPAPLSLPSAGIANATLGVPFSAALGAAGGVYPYTFSVVGGSPGAGLTLSGSTGVLSGTPGAAGVFSFAVQLTDAQGTSVTRTFSHAVEPAACANWPVRLFGATGAFYPDFPSAYLPAQAGNQIQLQALDYAADFLMDREVSVSLTGGYDCGYQSAASSSGMLGSLRVTGGSVKLDRLRFK